MKRQTRTESARPKPTAGPRSEAGRSGDDRSAYRRMPGPGGAAADKRTDVGPGAANLEFVSQLISIFRQIQTKFSNFYYHVVGYIFGNVLKSNSFSNVYHFYFQRGGYGRGRPMQ